MSQLRIYSGTDANFIVTTGHSIKLIKDKHSEFEAFSIHFSPERLQELLDLHTEVSNIPTDNVFIDIQAKSTDEVKNEHDQCCKFFQHSKFDIEMAFPNDKLLWNQFGFNDYDKARKSPRNMFMFLTDFDMMVLRYKDVLIANAWTEEKFAYILIRRNALKSKMDEQNDCMVERKQATERRMIKLNSLYEKLAVYFRAAHIIYDGDEELLKRFKFPSSTSSVKHPEDQEEVLPEETNN